MRTSTKLLVITLLLLLVNSTVNAQMDFTFSDVEQKEFVKIQDADQQKPLSEIGFLADLGFELSSYGLTCTQIGISDTYVWLGFDVNYQLELLPIGLGSDINYSKGSCKLKKLSNGNSKSLLVEFSDVEYLDFPGETFDLQIEITDAGDVFYHYGSNTQTEDHPLQNGLGQIILLEGDYERNKADQGGVNEYYRTTINLFGMPLNPGINSLPPMQYVTNFPPVNTRYHFKPASPSSVAVKTQLEEPVSLFPNPATGTFEIVTGNRKVTSVVLIDLSGRTRLQKTIDSKQSLHKVDLKGIPAGNYIVKVLNKDQLIHSQPLLVK